MVTARPGASSSGWLFCGLSGRRRIPPATYKRCEESSQGGLGFT